MTDPRLRMIDRRLAGTGVPNVNTGLPSREQEPELRPYGLRGYGGRRGVIDQMMLHPRIGTAFRNLRVEMQRTGTVWTPRDEADRPQVEFAELLQGMCDSSRILTDATEEGSGWHDVLGWVVDEWAYGFATANWTWRTDTRGRLVLEVYPIMPSTITRWSPDPETGTWNGIYQRTEMTAGITGGFIPRDRMIYVRTQGAPGEWEGVSILRPQLFGFESWKEASKAILMIMAAASGVIDVTAPPAGSDDADWHSMLDQMVAFEQGQRRWFMHPDGYKIGIQFPASGATGGLVEILQYWDSQIDNGLSQSMASLGFSANGSRALGETMSEEGAEQRKAALEILLGKLGLVLASVVAARVGYDGALPLLEPVAERKRDLSARVGLLGSAVTAGLVRWTPERERELAEEMDLAPIDAVPEQMAAKTCGCGRCGVRLAAPEGMQVVGADGRPFAFPVPLAPEEQVVSWVTNEEIRLAADDDLTRAVDQTAAEHRMALLQALPDEAGPIPPSADGIKATFRARYAQALGAYARRVAEEVAVQSAGERHRQVQPDGVRSYVVPDIAALEQSIGGRLRAMIEEVSEIIASRVQGELLSYWAGGGSKDGFESRQSRLAQEGAPIGNLIESSGRVAEGYVVGPDEGMLPVEALRTSIRDNVRCSVCEERHGTRHDLTTAEGMLTFLDSQLPDPDCEGRPRCRCGYVLRYRRVEPEEFAEIMERVGPVLGSGGGGLVRD